MSRARLSRECITSQLTLGADEVGSIRALLGELTSRFGSVEDEGFLAAAPVYAHELPRRVRVFLNDFKHKEPAHGVCVITGYPVDDARLGPTPAHWKERPAPSPALAEEMLFVLFGSLLGDPFAWATQQGGRLLHEVLPIKGDENEQISTGSQQTIWWHNEDAFHPYRGDYVALMCLRNPDRVPTTFASVDMLELDASAVKTLFEPRFVIRPDESHAEKNGGGGGGDETLRGAYEHIEAMRRNPQPQPVFLGHPRSPYLRLDPYFMPPPSDDVATRALNALVREIDSKLTEVVLRPGDFLFVDNYRAVHGRRSFKAKYDGTDRWLKRMNVTRDLRKSRDARPTSSSRVIF